MAASRKTACTAGLDMDNQGTIYADYQATTPVDPRVLAKMVPFWRNSFGNPHSSDHAIGWQADKAVQAASASVAESIGADPDEVIFTSGATEANNLALLGLARRAPATRRRILVSATEHKCVLGAARALSEREGFAVEVISVDREGFLDFEELEKRLDGDVLLVSVMAVNNEIGTIQDIPRIAKLLTAHGALYHCDAAQAPCALDVSDLAMHADLISLSGHKMYGPQGIGTLYIRRDLKETMEPLLYGGGQQEGLRSGTVPMPLCVGMAKAAEITRDSEAEKERKRVAQQRDMFVSLLKNGNLPVSVNGPTSQSRHPGNANICFHGCDAGDILGVLQPRLAASTGAACASGIPEPSHVLCALGLTAAQSDASIRFSFGRFTSHEDVKNAAHLVESAVASLSSEATSRSV